MKQNRRGSAIVIGGGFAGLSSAICLATAGFQVTLVEQHDQTGGRARLLSDGGFRFDMGPSWYWMPEIPAQFFARMGRSLHDYLTLTRLDPSYQVIFGKNECVEMPASLLELESLFEEIEPGAGIKLRLFLKEAEFKYKTALNSYIQKPGLSITEYFNREVLGSVFKMDMLSSLSSHARKFFKDKRLLQIIEFPVLFLGATPDKIPALYSLMNYADMALGTWYPMGGMHELSKAFTRLAEEMGVRFMMKTQVKRLINDGKKVMGIRTDDQILNADVIVSGADYHHTDQVLLGPETGNYSDRYWESREMAPSCLLYYVGVCKKLPGLRHHNLFFEHDFDDHAQAIYQEKSWPEKPLFYLCCPSQTDPSVAPEGMENLFFLIPTAPGLADDEAIRERYFREVISRTELHCGTRFADDIIYKKSYAHNDFVRDYHAFKGNAYGLANTLGQTAFLKPSIRHRKLSNLFYTGQLTVPGPGVPPAILSGQIVADYIIQHHQL
ncbi:phytoene desaturase family protein [Dyadobacter sp. MSC1_007]|jgi:phytoene desaturase|uniref:phytoene desaturase family protein n=1 Tax=Dyadobacter sp. MSC1_007 TaxID=2909264 RepID=UPI00202FFBFA|nr:phytoene desaturase family protein [Dyadobacter sp. MSC1_007]